MKRASCEHLKKAANHLSLATRHLIYEEQACASTLDQSQPVERAQTTAARLRLITVLRQQIVGSQKLLQEAPGVDWTGFFERTPRQRKRKLDVEPGTKQ